MVLLSSPVCEFGKKMPEFVLKDLDGNFFDSTKIENYNAILVFFICNHCPYVKAIITELVLTSIELKKNNIISIAIMPNDTVRYPEDGFENMKTFAKKNKFNFPYLIDETQNIAKKYGAVCTPDFFGYNSDLELQYRGRLRALKDLTPIQDSENELLKAMITISDTGKGPQEQNPSMGCNIKWK